MANASEKVDIEIGTSDYDDMENRNVNGCSLVTLKQVNPQVEACS